MSGLLDVDLFFIVAGVCAPDCAGAYLTAIYFCIPIVTC